MIHKKIWTAGLYIRLSQEDLDIGKSKKESNSITSQKELLQEFVDKQDDIEIFETYVDDGFTGTDFNRPGFQKLLTDMKKGKINSVIVKDLSRLGRNYIEVGNYIEQIFPLYNIRFIAVNDMIDSFKNPDSTNTIIVPFKNLINDEYCRDTSIKIRTALNTKKKKGEFVGAFAPYGYIKDRLDKHKLIIDKESAEIVKNIFNWYVYEGIGKISICHKLNDLGILNPTGYKKIKQKQNYKNYGIQDDKYNWTPSTIRNILKNEVYIGNTVQGKRKSKSYKIHKVEKVSKEDWIRVENTHKGIIDKETFEKAQDLNQKEIRTSPKEQITSIWAGLIKCNECQMAMNKKSSTNKTGKKYEYYICSTYRKKSNKLCTNHTIKTEKIYETILKLINMYIKKYVDINEVTKEAEKFNNNKNFDEIESLILEKENEIKRITNYKQSLYEDWKNEDITKEEYTEYKKKYNLKQELIEENIRKLKEEKKENKKENNLLKELKEKNQISKLTRNIISELIQCIYVKEDGSLRIKFNYKSCE